MNFTFDELEKEFRDKEKEQESAFERDLLQVQKSLQNCDDEWENAEAYCSIVNNPLFDSKFKSLDEFAAWIGVDKNVITKSGVAIEFAKKHEIDKKDISIIKAAQLSKLGDRYEDFENKLQDYGIPITGLSGKELDDVIKGFLSGKKLTGSPYKDRKALYPAQKIEKNAERHVEIKTEKETAQNTSRPGSIAKQLGVNGTLYKNVGIEVLRLPSGIANRLIYYKVDTVDKLLKMTWDEVLSIRTIGSSRRDDLEKALKTYLFKSAESEKKDSVGTKSGEILTSYNNVSIEELCLPLGIVYRLREDGIKSIGDLISVSKDELIRLRGKKEANIIEIYLNNYLQWNPLGSAEKKANDSGNIEKTVKKKNDESVVSAKDNYTKVKKHSENESAKEIRKQEDVVSVQEAALILGIGESKVYDLVVAGVLKGEKVNYHYQISKKSVEEYGKTIKKYNTDKHKAYKYNGEIYHFSNERWLDDSYCTVPDEIGRELAEKFGKGRYFYKSKNSNKTYTYQSNKDIEVKANPERKKAYVKTPSFAQGKVDIDELRKNTTTQTDEAVDNETSNSSYWINITIAIIIIAVILFFLWAVYKGTDFFNWLLS